jgi:hypothetical protein
VAVLLSAPEQRWECPNCPLKQATREVAPHTRFHACAGLAGLTAPMVPEGSNARVVANEREDYVGSEDVRMDGNGRPVMSITTEHPDGHTDCVVFAPTATAGSAA